MRTAPSRCVTLGWDQPQSAAPEHFSVHTQLLPPPSVLQQYFFPFPVQEKEFSTSWSSWVGLYVLVQPNPWDVSVQEEKRVQDRDLC